MLNIEDVKKAKTLFEEGKIKQEDMDVEMQFAVADLYKNEIEKIRDDIYNTKKDIALYNQMISCVDQMQKILEGFEE